MASFSGTWSFKDIEVQSPKVNTDISQDANYTAKGSMSCRNVKDFLDTDEDDDMTLDEQIRAVQRGKATRLVGNQADSRDRHVLSCNQVTSSSSHQGRTFDAETNKEKPGILSGEESSPDRSVFVDAREQQFPSDLSAGVSHDVFEHRERARLSTKQELPRNVQAGTASPNIEGYDISYPHQTRSDSLPRDEQQRCGSQDLASDSRPVKRHQSQPPGVMMQRRESDQHGVIRSGIEGTTRFCAQDEYNQQHRSPRTFFNEMHMPQNAQQRFSASRHGGVVSSFEHRHNSRNRHYSIPPSSMWHHEQQICEPYSVLQPRQEFQRNFLSPTELSHARQASASRDCVYGRFGSPTSSHDSPDEDIATLLRRSRAFKAFTCEADRQYYQHSSSMTYNDRAQAQASNQQSSRRPSIYQNSIIDLTSSPEGSCLAKSSYYPHRSSPLVKRRADEAFELSSARESRRNGSKESFNYPQTSQGEFTGERSHPRVPSKSSPTSSKTSYKIDPNVLEDRRQQYAAEQILAREYDAQRKETDMELFGTRIGIHNMTAQMQLDADRKLTIQKRRAREAEQLKKQEQREKQAKEEALRKAEDEKNKQVEKEKRDVEKAQRILIKREAEKGIEAAMQVERRKRAAEKLHEEKERKVSEARAKERDREQLEAINKTLRGLGTWASNMKSSIAFHQAGTLRGAKRSTNSDSDDDLFVSQKGTKRGAAHSGSKSTGPQNGMELLANDMYQPDQDTERQAEHDKGFKERQIRRRRYHTGSDGPKEQSRGNFFAPQPPRERKAKKSQGEKDYNADDDDTDYAFRRPALPLATSIVRLNDDIAREQEQKRKQEMAIAKRVAERAKKRIAEGKRLAQKARDAKEEALRKEWQDKGDAVDENKLRLLLEAYVSEFLKKRQERLQAKDLKSDSSTPTYGASFNYSTGGDIADTVPQPSAKENPSAEVDTDDPEEKARKIKRAEMTATLERARQESSIAVSFCSSKNTVACDLSDTESDISEEDPQDDPLDIIETIPAETTAEVQAVQRDCTSNNPSHNISSGNNEVQQPQPQPPQKSIPAKKQDDEHVYLYIATQRKVIKGESQGEEPLHGKFLKREEANKFARFHFDQLQEDMPKSTKFEYQTVDELFSCRATLDENNYVNIEVAAYPTLTDAIAGYSPSLIECRFSRKVFVVYLHTTYRKKSENEHEEPIIDNSEKCVDGQVWTNLQMANEQACKTFLDFAKPTRMNDIEAYKDIVQQIKDAKNAANQSGDVIDAGFEPTPDEMSWLALKGCQSFKVEVRELSIKGPIN